VLANTESENSQLRRDIFLLGYFLLAPGPAPEHLEIYGDDGYECRISTPSNPYPRQTQHSSRTHLPSESYRRGRGYAEEEGSVMYGPIRIQKRSRYTKIEELLWILISDRCLATCETMKEAEYPEMNGQVEDENAI